RTVDGVFLANATQIDLHAGGEREAGAHPGSLVPAHAPEHPPDLPGRRQAVAAVESPDLAQHAGGDVESAVAQSMELGGEIEQVCGFRVDVHRGALRRIDPIDDVARAIAAELLLDAPGFFCDGPELLPRHR